MILPIAPAYFRPCSPSNMTPECLMILIGCPRDRSMYPRTDRCDERRTRVCSSSASVAVAAEDVGATWGGDVFVDIAVAACVVLPSRVVSNKAPYCDHCGCGPSLLVATASYRATSNMATKSKTIDLFAEYPIADLRPRTPSNSSLCTMFLAKRTASCGGHI